MRSERSAVSGLGVLPAAGPGWFRSGPLAALADATEATLVARFTRGDDDLPALDQTPVPGAWRRRIRPSLKRLPEGSRLIFNALSQEYLDAAGAGSDESAWPHPSAVAVPELARFATAYGLTLEAVVPYGALLGHPLGGRSLLAPLDGSHRWRRAVSWLARDDSLRDLARFIEEEVVPGLPPGVAPYVLVVMERRVDPGRNTAHSERYRQAKAGLAGGGLAGLVPAPTDPTGPFVDQFDRLLQPLKARGFAFELLAQLATIWPQWDPAALLAPRRAGQFETWRRAMQIDSEVIRLAREWPAGCPERILHSTDITLSVDYKLVRDLLEQYYDLYEERLG